MFPWQNHHPKWHCISAEMRWWPQGPSSQSIPSILLEEAGVGGSGQLAVMLPAPCHCHGGRALPGRLSAQRFSVLSNFKRKLQQKASLK